jgi:hypothetical protein
VLVGDTLLAASAMVLFRRGHWKGTVL